MKSVENNDMPNLCDIIARCKKMEKQALIEGSKMKIEWGSQIRNYVMQPYKLVKDLRTNYETSNVQAVLDGEINDFLKSYLMEFGGKV